MPSPKIITEICRIIPHTIVASARLSPGEFFGRSSPPAGGVGWSAVGGAPGVSACASGGGGVKSSVCETTLGASGAGSSVTGGNGAETGGAFDGITGVGAGGNVGGGGDDIGALCGVEVEEGAGEGSGGFAVNGFGFFFNSPVAAFSRNFSLAPFFLGLNLSGNLFRSPCICFRAQSACSFLVLNLRFDILIK